MKILIVQLTLALILTGCAGTYYKDENRAQLKPGMTKAEVMSLMGKPYMRMTVTDEVEKWIWSWSSPAGTKAIGIVFTNDTVSFVPQALKPLPVASKADTGQSKK